MFREFTLLLVATSLASARQHTWPDSQLDELEHLRFDQAGYNSAPFAGGVTPCDTYLFDQPDSKTGRSNTADWIRTAYHDMATHDVNTGEGGMDASIRFEEEQSRPENAGGGFADTLRVLHGVATQYTSIADSLALGALTAIENCGGPILKFRGGRVDALSPNNPGVPEPQQSIDEHVASFAKQGFTPTEMIGLVACGHTFGGVQHSALPDIVPELNDPTHNSESNVPFDSTNSHFDNTVVTEYVAGTTVNPLVVNTNDTFNSDKRIFAHDGNATMNAFAANPDLFATTCGDLFSRMIDTVPTGVQLTDVIDPLPLKPHNVDLEYAGDGTLRLRGSIRIWNSTLSSNGVVKMRWTDRSGRSAPRTASTVTLGHTEDMIGTALGHRITNIWYTFNHTENPGFIQISENAGIGSVEFSMGSRTFDQGGKGFKLSDELMWSATSCSADFSNPDSKSRFDIAVRKDVSQRLKKVWIESTRFNDVPVVDAIEIPRPTTTSTSAGGDGLYEIWSIEGDQIGSAFGLFELKGQMEGGTVVAHGMRGQFSFAPCPA